jgi:hypothetical protein
MPQETDLMGIGMPVQQAHILGNQSQKVTGTGTSQATGALLETNMAELTTAGGNTAFTLANNSNDPADIGTPVYVANSTATAGLVFVPSGHTLNGTANGSLSIAQNKLAYFVQFAVKNWFSVLSN